MSVSFAAEVHGNDLHSIVHKHIAIVIIDCQLYHEVA